MHERSRHPGCKLKIMEKSGAGAAVKPRLPLETGNAG
jgi:hypothetical protein